MWGASVIRAPETSQGLRVSNQSCGFRRVTVRGLAMGLLLPVHREEITQVQEKRIWFYLKKHWNISLPSVYDITFPFTKETLSIQHIIIC